MISRCARSVLSNSSRAVCGGMSEEIPEPSDSLLIRAGQCGWLLLVGATVLGGLHASTPLDEPDRGRIRRTGDTIGETADAGGQAQADGRIEDRLGGVVGAHQARATAGHDDARGQ